MTSRPASTGKPVRGYEARVVDDEMNEVPRGTVGRLAVRGPTGCRYLADERQRDYVRDGWNLTGDSFVQDEAGYFHFAARVGRHDHLGRLQHRRPRGRGGAADARRRRSNAP